MYKVIEYNKKYKKETLELLIDIMTRECNIGLDINLLKKELSNELDLVIKNKNLHYLIAIDEMEKVIGTISLEYKENNEAYLKRMYVHYNHRGAGIAQNLFDTVMDKAKENYYSIIYLGTYKKLERAINFYIKNGFVQNENEHDNEELYFYKDLLEETKNIAI